MTNTIVYQIELKAWTDGQITVLLYSGETLAGQCKSHSGSGTETLSCDELTADRVRLSMSNTSRTYLAVDEITVEYLIKPGERHKYMLCS